MQEFPRSDGASGGRGRARASRLFATFKLATPYVEMVRRSDAAAHVKTPANVNRANVNRANMNQANMNQANMNQAGVNRAGLVPMRPEHA